jgi:hypothetical protein
MHRHELLAYWAVYIAAVAVLIADILVWRPF